MVWKILLRTKWQPTPVFMPGGLHGQRSMAGYSPQGRRVGHECACMRAHTHTHVTSLDWHKPPLALFHTDQAPDKAAPLSSEPPHPGSSCSSLLPQPFHSRPYLLPKALSFPSSLLLAGFCLPGSASPSSCCADNLLCSLSPGLGAIVLLLWERALPSSSEDNVAQPPPGPSGGPSRTQPLSQVPSQPSSLGEA